MTSDATAKLAAAELFAAADDLKKTRTPLYINFGGDGWTVEAMHTVARMIARGEKVPVDMLGHFAHYIAQQVDRACKETS